MVQKREIVVYIILTLITCGIFGLYWFVCLTDDINTLAGETDTSGAVSLLLTIVTCGIYGIYWAYRQGEKIDKVKRMRGIQASNGGILYLILYIVSSGLIAYALMQNDINNMISK